MIYDIQDKVLLITGAGKGKGRTLAEAFARLGAFVAVNDVSPINLDELVDQGGGRVKAYTEDIAKKVAIQSIIKQVEDEFGRIDILINHAAVEPRSPLLDMDEWDWHRVLDVNLTGAFLAMQSVGRVMRAQGSGVIVNLISFETSEAQDMRDKAAYRASMHGLLELTCAAAAELLPFGIHVHAVGSGLAAFKQSGPGMPQDLVEAVLYLCSSSATGQIVNVEAP
jgi:NAD(P)-dependent dehydrogenase (short-subunit alcohol dehydrogenase family)